MDGPTHNESKSEKKEILSYNKQFCRRRECVMIVLKKTAED